MTEPDGDVLFVDTVGAFVGRPRVLLRGAVGGPLTGATLSVKDLFDVAGTVTGAGNPTFADGRQPATTTAPAVEALVVAGATVVGKTITDELAYSLAGANVHFGTPVNVAAPGRIPGGSSAGSAASVAAGLCDLGLGSDTGGSIRVPASYCGILGWRPTHGAVDDGAMVHLSRSFDTVGLLARDPDLLVRAADVLLGDPDTGPTPAGPAAFVGGLLDQVGVDARASVLGSTEGWCDGPAIELGVDLSAAVEAFRVLQGAEAWAEHGAWITSRSSAMAPDIAARFTVASQVTAEEVEAANAVRAEVRTWVGEATAGGHLLLGPAAAGAAPRLDEPPDSVASTRAATMRLTCLGGLAGAPVVVLPVARDDGLPLGVAVMGAPGTDRSLLRWARDRLAA